MVEGHSVHRVAAFHRQRLVGKAFAASSPNGRFTKGASAVNEKVFDRIEAVGKNLFCFFGDVVVHIHFGMAGNWAVYDVDTKQVPPPTKTNRLRFEGHGMVADLSAMTVQHGGIELYESKRAKLGEDPLRQDANSERLWSKVRKTDRTIGALLMDQSYFAGPGNIYRAEILFKACVHPEIPGTELTRDQFDIVWYHTVQLLQRGFQTGSILTVDPEEAAVWGGRRRYIYNCKTCPRCASSIRTWQINNRTCYACPTCQPRSTPVAAVTPEKNCVPFNSHCARESISDRLHDPNRLTVKDIKQELSHRGQVVPAKARKSELVSILQRCLAEPTIVSSKAAAVEKTAAGESLAVEHIAELAPAQARHARASAKRAVTKDDSKASKSNKRVKARLSSASADISSPKQVKRESREEVAKQEVMTPDSGALATLID